MFCRTILREISTDSRVVLLCGQAGLRSNLTQMLDQLDRCQKALTEYLEQKRALFPRFYFIGDEDLLEILAQSTNPAVIQSHLKKLFAGIHSVTFDETNTHILSMNSLEGEVVPLKNKVKIQKDVEVSIDYFVSSLMTKPNSWNLSHKIMFSVSSGSDFCTL